MTTVEQVHDVQRKGWEQMWWGRTEGPEAQDGWKSPLSAFSPQIVY